VKPSAEPLTIPEEHRISIVAVPRPGSDLRDLVARVSAPPLELKLAEVESSRRCGLVKEIRIQRSGLSPSPGRGVMLSCGPDVSVPVIVEGNRLQVGETSRYLGPSPVIHPEKVEGYEPVACSSAEPKKRPLREISLERRDVTSPDPEADRVYSLGAIMDGAYRELARLPKTPMSCESSRGSAASEMKVTCEFGERGMSLRLGVEEGVLWVERWDENYVGSELRERFGWVVGCDHRTVFPRFALKDSGFKALVPTCSDTCRLTNRACLNSCYRAAADGRGLLGPPGVACTDSCDSDELRCSVLCQVDAR
jgi:hypothetical protein